MKHLFQSIHQKTISSWYRVLNHARKRILLYADSRGHHIVLPNRGRSEPLALYPGDLAKAYCLDYYIRPVEYTTLIDFLRVYETRRRHYDFVIAHVGIVDFAPRKQSVVRDKIYPMKKEWCDRIFGEEKMRAHLETDLGIDYEGERTNNLMSLQMAEEHLIPRLQQIPNLIWVGYNRVVEGWNGNYKRPRPANISIIEEYAALFCQKLPRTVNLLDWSDAEVMEYTYDNIHLTPKGSAVVLERILEMMGL